MYWRFHVKSPDEKLLKPLFLPENYGFRAYVSGALIVPRIFDNIDLKLLPILKESLQDSKRADFCVGYFNLRGWRQIDDLVEQFSGGDDGCCRLIVGMQKLPRDQFRSLHSLVSEDDLMDNPTAARLRKQVAQEFREQLMVGAPNNEDEEGLRRLSRQLRSGKLVVKLFLRHSLHAKLYLTYPRLSNPNLRSVGFLGSSNLTLSGLRYQGELNVDVLDHDATEKLEKWFERAWKDQFCVDISQDLAQLIDESWAREELLSPYHIYLKIAYHLSQEARTGLSEYRVPREFRDRLFDFQSAAVRIAAQHVNKRGGVLIGDVVGLGKTMVGSALARILQEDHFLETLIICPKNLVPMWRDYVREYRLLAEIIPISQVQSELPSLRRYRVVLIDESHNLRNTSGKRYRAIQEYIAINESKCILLTATPYNKTYLDLSAQLRLFIPDDKDLGLRPEKLIHQEGGEGGFKRKHQVPVRSIRAFELSEYADDWRDLMRLYMVRRTRSFIKSNYAQDEGDGRKYLTYQDGSRAYFPMRIPRTARFEIGTVQNDVYARLYSDDVVTVINHLTLPRYGLGNYINTARGSIKVSDAAEQRQLDGLSRAGRRLMGFCRTNLFKRLESSGIAFIQSLERHILRNYIYLHAIEHDLEIPIGTQDAELLDTRNVDEDSDSLLATLFEVENDGEDSIQDVLVSRESDYQVRATEVYQTYATQYRRRFKWIRAGLFTKQLAKDLRADAKALAGVLRQCGRWESEGDRKLQALIELLQTQHLQEKVLVFTQFADTARYLRQALVDVGVRKVALVSGDSADPTETAWRFSPESNGKRREIASGDEHRVLIATDVLSEGQNLQDCAIVVNYDLPWAIIRLIQRAGRVDRIGQKSEEILCYSFLPAEGVDRLINLRGRLLQRLAENAEVVGTDEAFFEERATGAASQAPTGQMILDLYNEKSGILDGEEDTEVDLTSEAFQIWLNATKHNPSLKKTIEEIPSVVYATRRHQPTATHPEGVLLYMRTSEGNDALAWVDRRGQSVTQSQLAILRAAACEPDTPGVERDPAHHKLVQKGVEVIAEDERSTGGQLGRKSGARYRTYERLKRYAQEVKGTLFESADLLRAIDEIYQHPLRQSAIDRLNRQLKSGIDDQQLAELVVALRTDDDLCLVQNEGVVREPQIICSLGLFGEEG
jgi:SNF2 family DNA or RNA helicase